MLITHARPLRPPRDREGQIIVTPQDGVFVAISAFTEKEVLKGAGFFWSREIHIPGYSATQGHWWTDDAVIAARLGPYCDDIAAPYVRDIVLDRKASRIARAEGSYPCPPGRAYLPYQVAGIEYAMKHANTLFADEMGLGKTIEAIGVINATVPTPEKILIVCPASLKRNWARELQRWLVHPLALGIAEGSRWPLANVVIINYDLLQRQHGRMADIDFDILVVDEAHLCKNPSAARSRAVYAIKAKRKLYLTGTPIVNRPIELYPIVHSLDSQRWHSQQRYKSRYCDGKNGGRNLDELQDILRSTVMVRRLKSDVLKELPPKRRQVLELPCVDGNGADGVAELQRILGNSDLNDVGWLDAFTVDIGESGADFAELSRIRHRDAVAKAPIVAQHIADLLEETAKVVVFTHHHDVASIISGDLSQYGVVTLTGETPMGQRQRLVDRFQHGEGDVRVFVGSIGAAGVGWTLTAADTVVIAELDWVPGNLKQAEDRCHRIGSEVHESILVQYVVMEGTVDALIADKLVEKIATIERAMDHETVQSTHEKKAEPEMEIGTRAAAPPMQTRELRFKADEYQSRGIRGGDGQLLALQRCIHILVGIDKEIAADGPGFGVGDSTLGVALAAWGQQFTPGQATAALRLVRKYAAQLPHELRQMALWEVSVR